MARARKSVAAYPLQQFNALFTRIAETKGELTIPCTRNQALTMQGELYAFRATCEKDPGEAETHGVNVAALRDCQFRLVTEGLQARHVSLNPTVSLLETALDGTESIVTPAQEALERLRQMGGGS